MNPDDQNGNGGGTPLDVPVTPTGENGQYTPEEQTEVQGWEDAAADIFPGIKKVDDGGNGNEPAQPAQGAQNGQAPQANNQGQAPNEGQGNGNAADKGGQGQEQNGGKPDGQADEADTPEPTDAFSRVSQREQQQAVEYMQNDVRSRMFAATDESGKPLTTSDGDTMVRTASGDLIAFDKNGNPAWVDKDGDPIRSLEDVMRHTNPNTGRPFTEEEAGMYLLQAQQQLSRDVSNMTAQIDQISKTNLDLKDEADIINYEFGALLRHPDFKQVRESLAKQYEATLIKDPKTGIITKAPVSLEQFYRTALTPYANMGRQLQTQQAQQQQQQVQQTQQQNDARQARRQDRSDIYGGGKTDVRTDEAKDWDAAAQAVFGDQLKSLR